MRDRNARAIQVDPMAPDEDAIRRAVAILEDGGIVAYPTETFYGLAVDADSTRACAKLFDVKGRPQDRALPCMIASAADLAALATDITPEARFLSEHFWPGPLTLVVEARSGFAAVSKDGSAAVRVSGLALARRLCQVFGGPLTATSANRTGSAPSTSAKEVLAQLDDSVDLVLDGGVAPGGLPSTIVDVRGDRPALLRAGAIPFDDVIRALAFRKS
jgi:L-threonylcarbamoyladenylate synthase